MHGIFVSRPAAVNPDQEAFCDSLNELLAERGCSPRTLGHTDYPNVAPIAAVRELMAECNGVLILGLRQIHVRDGVSKSATSDEHRIDGAFFPTAWNQLEAGVAFAMDLPIMIVREDGVEGGIFDAGSSDRFVHQAEMTGDWVHRPQFFQPFNDWLRDVESHSQPT
jgi:hypothetical protein